MATVISQSRVRYAKYIMAGTLSGAIFGILSGPLAMICFIALESYRRHIDPTGFELLVAPVFGVLCGAAEGAVFGVLWARGMPSGPRFKISQLMGLVLISTLVMGFFVLLTQLAVLALFNGLVLLPIAALMLKSIDLVGGIPRNVAERDLPVPEVTGTCRPSVGIQEATPRAQEAPPQAAERSKEQTYRNGQIAREAGGQDRKESKTVHNISSTQG